MEQYRNDFPMLKQKYIYFNNASTTYKPTVVIDAITDFYTKYSVNTNRGVDSLGFEVTKKFENVRKNISKFINSKTDEIVFTRGTTEALNLVAYGLEELVKEGDEIVVTIAEHHANYLPWYELASRKNAKLIVIDYKNLENNLKETLSSKTKIVAINHVSNVLGIKNNLKNISNIVRTTNAFLVVDGAQGIVHEKIDVRDLDIDFYAFSGHKIYGPMGVGVLYGKESILDKIKPLHYGGEMIDIVTKETVSYKKAPYKFEGGTMMIPEVLGLGAAIDYIESITHEKIKEHIKTLREYLITEMSKLDNIIIYNKEVIDSNLITFNIKNIHSHDISSLLDKNNIIVRAGHHCAAPLMEELGVNSTIRISLALYNTKEECDVLINTLKKAGDYLDVLF